MDELPVPNGYNLGPGDELVVNFYGNEDLSTTSTVGRTGAVEIPLLGSIQVGGLSYEQAKELVASRVKNQLVGTQFSLSLGRLKSISVMVLGEVRRPGRYALPAQSTLTQALFQAGGLGEKGSFRKILLNRRDSS